MAVKFPQIDLPRVVSGASDFWDNPAGQVIDDDYFSAGSGVISVSMSESATALDTLSATGGGGSVITAVNKTTGADAVGGASFTTASVLLSSNKLGLLTVSSSMNSSVTPNTPTITGWTLVNSIEFDTGAPSQKKVSTFRRASTSAYTGTHTINFGGQSQTHCDWVIDEFTNVDLSGLSISADWSYVSTAVVTTNADPVFTFTGVGIGTANANRRVVCVIKKQRPAGRPILTATIGGISANVHVDVIDAVSGSSVGIFSAVVPTGTTATIVVEFDGTTFSGSNNLDIYTIDNSTIIPTIVGASNITGGTGTTSLSTNYTATTGGFVIGSTHWANGSVKAPITTTGYTQDDTRAAYVTFSRAETSDGSKTETTTWTGTFEAATGIAIFTGGDNGASAIVQSQVNKDETFATGSLTVTLSAFGSTDNATYGAFAHGGTVATNTAGSGFSFVASNVGYTKIATEFRNDNDTTVDMSSNAFDQHGGIAIELKRATGGGGGSFSVSNSETVTAAETQTSNKTAPVSNSESGSALETLTSNKTASVTQAESGSIIDTHFGNLSALVSVSETSTIAEVVSNLLTAPVSVAETISALESVTSSSSGIASISESGSLAETISKNLIAALSQSETSAISETNNAVILMAVTVAESVTALENITKNLIANLSISETSTVSETLTGTLAGVLSMVESGSASETLTAQLRASLSIVESSGIGEVQNVGAVFGVYVAETLTASETINRQLVALLSVSDSYAILESVTSNLSVLRSITESGSATDNIQTIAAFILSVSEIGSVLDVLTALVLSNELINNIEMTAFFKVANSEISKFAQSSGVDAEFKLSNSEISKFTQTLDSGAEFTIINSTYLNL